MSLEQNRQKQHLSREGHRCQHTRILTNHSGSVLQGTKRLYASKTSTLSNEWRQCNRQPLEGTNSHLSEFSLINRALTTFKTSRKKLNKHLITQENEIRKARRIEKYLGKPSLLLALIEESFPLWTSRKHSSEIRKWWRLSSSRSWSRISLKNFTSTPSSLRRRSRKKRQRITTCLSNKSHLSTSSHSSHPLRRLTPCRLARQNRLYSRLSQASNSSHSASNRIKTHTLHHLYTEDSPSNTSREAPRSWWLVVVAKWLTSSMSTEGCRCRKRKMCTRLSLYRFPSQTTTIVLAGALQLLLESFHSRRILQPL